MERIGKYEVLEKIGSGGFAIVYKGFDPFLKRAVAIKVCYSRDEETRQRFFREAEIAGNLVHRNITTIFDFGLHDQMPYLVEEYLPGEDLAHMVRRREPHHLEQKLDFLMQIASGMEYAHQQGVIHRDIKPSNVRVVDGTVLKIMDFGTAKLANVESHLTQTGMTLGTVAYLSPERLLGKPSGTNSDIFSFGVLAFELLSFRRPFSGRNIPHLIDQVLNAAPVALSDVWEECPPRLDDLVQRSLAKDPSERYADCSEILRDLDEVVIELTGESRAARDGTASQKVQLPPTNLQLTGLLERARQLHARGKFQRALLILEEVLEMDPDNADAKQLEATCREAEEGEETPEMRTEARTGLAWEGPEERRTRKIGEAVESIEGYVNQGQMLQAVDALRFAQQLFGSVEDAPALRRKIVAAARRQLSQVKGEALKAARRIIDQMVMLRQQGRLDLPSAELFAFQIAQLDPDDVVSRDLLELVRQEAAAAQSKTQVPAGEIDRKRDDAVRSIERFLADGNASMARDALSFAIQMLGEFDEAASLRARIDDALDGTAAGSAAGSQPG